MGIVRLTRRAGKRHEKAEQKKGVETRRPVSHLLANVGRGQKLSVVVKVIFRGSS